MISVVIPVYNSAPYLAECFGSLLAQTFADWEAVLVDDGSTDGSGAMCDEAASADARFRVIHQPNAGVSSARNAGLDAARGDWVAFVDSDDRIDPTYLADFGSRDTEADLIVSGSLYDTHGRLYSRRLYGKTDAVGTDAIRRCFFSQGLDRNGYPWGKLFRKRLIDDAGLRFDTRLSINEDTLFVFGFWIMCGRVRVTDTAGYHYNVFDQTGLKLSDREPPFAVYKLASECFGALIDRMSVAWGYSGGDLAAMRGRLVYAKRLLGLKALLSEGDRGAFGVEEAYWRSTEWDANWTAGRMALRVLRAPLPVSAKQTALKVFYGLQRFRKTDRAALIYKDLASRSERV